MSDRKKYNKSSFSDFIRYRQGKMPAKEKHTFERKLQKDPFSDEASEGFASLSPETARKDISALQKQLDLRTSGRKGLNYYRIAASVAVLMVISTIFILLNRHESISRSGNKSVPAELTEIAENKKVNTPPEPEKNDKGSEFSDKRVPEKPAEDKSITARVKDGEKDKNEELAIAPKSEQPDDKKGRAAEISAVAANVPAAMISSENKKALAYDKNLIEDSTGLVSGVVVEGHRPPEPVNGPEDFRRYILENIRMPEDAEPGERAVVILSFIVRTDGIPDSIYIVSSPGKQFSDEAVRLVKEGPEWKPALDNGREIEDKVKLRIVFR